MLKPATYLASAVAAVVVCLSSYLGPASAGNDGVVRVKSVYPIEETISRLKNDIAAKGIVFFSEVDQSQLAAGAGIALRPSVLLTFGNPPLGTQFITSNPNAGLDWPVRLLVFESEKVKSGPLIRISGGLLAGTGSRTAGRNSRWLPK
jgi:hypothetical protein